MKFRKLKEVGTTDEGKKSEGLKCNTKAVHKETREKKKERKKVKEKKERKKVIE